MSVLDSLLGIIAPHDCIGCGREGALLCSECLYDKIGRLPERCYRCKQLSPGARTCQKCRKSSPLQHVYIRAQYDGLAKELIGLLKFERGQAAATPIAELCAEALPFLDSVIIVPVPTASSRVRVRGYDQAELIARQLATAMRQPCVSVLRRLGQTRQVGASKRDRHTHLEGAFRVINPDAVRGKTILLVDDVITTGATVEEAARCVRQAGATHVSAVLFAQKQ